MEIDCFIGRQPIFDRKKDLAGYELLYRANLTTNACTIDPEIAAPSLIAHTFLDVGLKQIAGQHPAFINCPQDFLLTESHLLLPKKEVVIEVLENVAPTPEVLAVLKRTKAMGYKIALDDFVMRDDLREFVDLADIIKIDVLQQSSTAIKELIATLRGRSVEFLAEKVETEEQYNESLAMGFKYFQGYFFARPKIVAAKSVPAVHIQVMRIMSALEDDNVSFDAIERSIANDVSIAYRLLKFVNSAAYGFTRQISAVKNAVAMVGLVEIRKWLRVIFLAKLTVNKPSELLRMSLVRARFCELVFGRGQAASQAFTLGLFSLLEAILDQRLPDIIAGLSLAPELRDALLEQQSPISFLLQLARAFEQADWDVADTVAELHKIDRAQLSRWYIEAIKYAKDVYDVANEKH